MEARKPLVAMYVGGMGSDTHNFHAEAMARRGWPEASARIVELWRAGRRDEAVAAVPDGYIDSQSLLGSTGRIRARWPEAVPAGLTGVIVRCGPRRGELALAAELAGTRDTAEAGAQGGGHMTDGRPRRRRASGLRRWAAREAGA